MVWIRIIFVAFLAMYVMYYVLMIGHLFNLWKVVNVKIEGFKLLIPFYYLTKLND